MERKKRYGTLQQGNDDVRISVGGGVVTVIGLFNKLVVNGQKLQFDPQSYLFVPAPANDRAAKAEVRKRDQDHATSPDRGDRRTVPLRMSEVSTLGVSDLRTSRSPPISSWRPKKVRHSRGDERFEPVEVEGCDDDHHHQCRDGAGEEDGYGDCDLAKRIISGRPARAFSD